MMQGGSRPQVKVDRKLSKTGFQDVSSATTACLRIFSRCKTLGSRVKISILFDQPISNINILQLDHCSIDDNPVGDNDHHGHVDRPVDDYPAGDDDHDRFDDHQDDQDDLTGIKDQQLRILGVHLCCCSVCSKRSASAHRTHFLFVLPRICLVKL